MVIEIEPADGNRNGLTAQEVAGRKKLILPIWHNVGHEDMMRYSPTLADKVALSTQKMGLEAIAEAIAEVLPGQPTEGEEDRLVAKEALPDYASDSG